MNPEWIAKLATQAKMKGIPLTFEKGQILFYEGHQPFGAFLIQDGRVIHIAHSKSGREQTIGSSEEGDCVGLQDILENTPYAFTARSATESHVVFVSRPQVEELFKNKRSLTSP